LRNVDQLVLVHPRAAFDADLLRALVEIALRPVLVGVGLAATAARRLAPGVGDARRLLLALALLAQSLVLLVVLDLTTVALGHVDAPSAIDRATNAGRAAPVPARAPLPRPRVSMYQSRCKAGGRELAPCTDWY
jgi:hypothetical protein